MVVKEYQTKLREALMLVDVQLGHVVKPSLAYKVEVKHSEHTNKYSNQHQLRYTNIVVSDKFVLEQVKLFHGVMSNTSSQKECINKCIVVTHVEQVFNSFHCD